MKTPEHHYYEPPANEQQVEDMLVAFAEIGTLPSNMPYIEETREFPLSRYGNPVQGGPKHLAVPATVREHLVHLKAMVQYRG